MATVAEVKARARAKARAEERKKKERQEALAELIVVIGGMLAVIYALCFIGSIPEIIADVLGF